MLGEVFLAGLFGNNKNPPKGTPKFNIAKALKPFENLFDWIEVSLSKVKDVTEKYIKDAANSIGYITQNLKLDKAAVALKKELQTNQKAYDAYMAQANAIASATRLSPDIISKVQNGSIDITSYKPDLQNAIKAYQDWYDKAQSVADAIDEIKKA